MPVKAVEAVERLAFERESEHVENEPRIMLTTSRPQQTPQPAALSQIILLAI